MLNPHQVREWERQLSENAAVRDSFLGYNLGRIDVHFGPTPVDSDQELRGVLETPAELFGQPFDRSCLDGITRSDIYSHRTLRHTFIDARIVGNAALATMDGDLWFSSNPRPGNKKEFLAVNESGNQGFLFEDLGEIVRLYFIQRNKPCRRSLHALFFHNIEPENYGSFMFRQLPQLVEESKRLEQFDCYIVPERTSFFAEALELLMLPKKPIYSAAEIAGDAFAAITVYDYDDAEGFFGAATVKACRELSRKITAARPGVVRPERIYVSRSLSHMRRPWYRVMNNESEIEMMARTEGFAIVYPETMSFGDQIATFSHARSVVGPSGSGMFNVLFSENHARIVDIETFHVTVRQHAKLYSSCGGAYSFLFANMAEPNDERPPMVRPSICLPSHFSEAMRWAL